MRWFIISLLMIPLCCAQIHPHPALFGPPFFGVQVFHPINKDHHKCSSSNPGAAFREGCDWCVCARGRVRCTRNPCSDEDLKKLRGTPRCRRGKIQWIDQCNSCGCDSDTKSRACTKKGCPPNPNRRRRSSALPALGDTSGRGANKCRSETRNAWWRSGCIICSCSGGHILCSRDECRADGTPPVEAECAGQVEWQKDCNTCRCIGGTVACTEKACGLAAPSVSSVSPSSQPEPKPKFCLEGTRTKHGCNDCLCINGRQVCTQRVCAPAPHPDHLTVCDLPTHLEKTEGCRALIRRFTYQVGSQDCVETIYTGCGGSENLFRDIDTCRSFCGVTNSTRVPLGSDVGPVDRECTEGSLVERDCNTCVCRGGRLQCTNKFCSNDKPKGGDICLHPPIFNPIVVCRFNYPIWSYIKEAQECRELFIHGCSETDNHFKDLESCQNACRHQGLRQQTEVATRADPRCLKKPIDGDCPRVLEPRYLFDPEIGRCLRTYTSTCGDMTESFGTLQECQFSCAG